MQRLVLAFLAVVFGLAPGRANPDFERGAGTFSADGARTSPAFATAAQSFSVRLGVTV